MTLNRNEQKALGALLQTTTVKAAARAAGLSERTVYRYLADPDFRAELRKRQDQVIGALIASLAGASGGSVSTLCAIQKDVNNAPSVRRSAAATILTHTRHFLQHADVLTRLDEIERLLDNLMMEPTMGGDDEQRGPETDGGEGRGGEPGRAEDIGPTDEQ